MKKPPKWVDVYSQGTKTGDEELAFWISLARNPKWTWRSTSSIAKETGLSKERVEKLLMKYYNKGMVFQNPQNEDQWGYWERNPGQLSKDDRDITTKDHDDRIDRAMNM
jgi:hypothetical protein